MNCSLKEIVPEIRQRYPHKFVTWQLLLNNFIVCCEILPGSSLSIPGRKDVEQFREFLIPRVGLKTLDVGCGPYFPSYLNLLRTSCYGIDVLEAKNPQLWQERKTGYAEALPWPDGFFDSVIFATTLDHVIDLPDTIAEAVRVTTTNVLVWTAEAVVAQPKEAHLAEVEDWLFYSPKGTVDPFHSRYIQPDEIIQEFRRFGLSQWTTISIPGSLFMEFTKCSR